jgi:DNA-binding transcriptional MerR regulator
MAVSTPRKEAEASPGAGHGAEAGIRIGDAATRVGVSARTLRYYEEPGLLTPSEYTPGGERRYTPDDPAHLQRILEWREVLGMNLDERREFLTLESRLQELRASCRATKKASEQEGLEQEGTARTEGNARGSARPE